MKSYRSLFRVIILLAAGLPWMVSCGRHPTPATTGGSTNAPEPHYAARYIADLSSGVIDGAGPTLALILTDTDRSMRASQCSPAAIARRACERQPP